MIDSAGIRMAQGDTISSERKEGVNDNMAKSHYHNFFEIYYLESGERFHMIKDELYHLHSGEFIIFSPYIMHHSYGNQDMPFRRIVLYFNPDEIQSSELKSAVEKGYGVYKTDNRTRFSIHQILEILISEDETGKKFKKEYKHTLLNLLAVTIARQASPEAEPIKQTRIGQVIKYIQNHYNEHISLDMLTQEFYISQYYLCREFKKYTNRTIIQYINITRVINAQNMIMETNKSITAISNATGFSNLTHFNRIFKEITDMTPSGYKKMYKKDCELKSANIHK